MKVYWIQWTLQKNTPSTTRKPRPLWRIKLKSKPIKTKFIKSSQQLHLNNIISTNTILLLLLLLTIPFLYPSHNTLLSLSPSISQRLRQKQEQQRKQEQQAAKPFFNDKTWHHIETHHILNTKVTDSTMSVTEEDVNITKTVNSTKASGSTIKNMDTVFKKTNSTLTYTTDNGYATNTMDKDVFEIDSSITAITISKHY